MELYTKSTNRTISNPIPMVSTGNLVVEIIRDGVVVQDIPTVTYNNGTYSFDFPFSLTISEADYQIRWAFNYIENSTNKTYEEYTDVSVVTPILDTATITAILDGADADVATVERAVRHIIQAHTGQSFGYYIGTRTVVGTGERMLRLPERIISLNSVNGSTYWVGEYYVHRDNYYLVVKNPVWEGGIRADFDGYQGEYLSNVPIYAPGTRVSFVFPVNMQFVIDGTWGWTSVPEAVKEAAKLLVNDYACGDNIYRDRFVQIATGPDWRLEFNSGAYSDTGNVRANQLLSEYVVKYGWDVV